MITASAPRKPSVALIEMAGAHAALSWLEWNKKNPFSAPPPIAPYAARSHHRPNPVASPEIVAVDNPSRRYESAESI